MRRLQRGLGVGFGSLALALTLTAVAAARPADSLLNPKTYASPSGDYSLHVDPDSKEGDSGARYRLALDGKEVWAGHQDFALWDAAVGDSGLVAGYSYERGLDGFVAESSTNALTVVLMDPAGHVLLKDDRPRHGAGMHSPFEPLGEGLVLDEGSDRLIVRVRGDTDTELETWWTYSLRAAKALGDLTPSQPTKKNLAFHRPIFGARLPGAPLVLLHWYIADYSKQGVESNAAQLSALTLDGTEVWRLDIPDEYNGLKEHWSWYYDLVDPGITQMAVEGTGFTFHSYNLKSRLTFAAAADPAAPTGWTVHEVRRDEAPPPTAKKTPEPAVTNLKPLGSITLRFPPPSSKIRAIHSFAVGPGNTFAAVRWDANDGALLLIDPTGKVLAERALVGDNLKDASEVAPLADGRWLLFVTGLGNRKAAAWVCSSDLQKMERLDGLEAGGLRTAAPMPDSGFAAIAGDNWLGVNLIVFDQKGHRRWSQEAFQPQGVAVTTDGRVALLEGIHNQIRLFDADGKALETVDLADALGGKPNYVAGLRSAPDGGLVLHDFNGSPPVYTLDTHQRKTAGLTPRYPDGRLFRIIGGVQASPDGRLWTSDGNALVRLGHDGEIDQSLGPAPSENNLTGYCALTCDANGSFYAVDRSNGAVHVFDRQGQHQRVLRPNPTDFVTESGIGSVTVAGDGSVYSFPSRQYLRGGSSGYLHFAPDGGRVGMEEFVLGEVREEWFFQPSSRKRWVIGYTSLALLDSDGKEVQRILKRPGGDWLGLVHDAAVAPDGSLAVIAGPDGMGTRGPGFICVYDPAGAPVRALPLPFQYVLVRLAFNGRTIAVTSDDDVIFVPLDGSAMTRATLPSNGARQKYWSLLCAPDGQELWAVIFGSAEIQRFVFP